jgi:hypothetical protein
MLHPDGPLVLLDLDLNVVPDLNLATYAGNAVNARCFQAEVILHGLNVTGDIP